MKRIWFRIARRVQGKVRRQMVWAIVVALIYLIWRSKNESIWISTILSPKNVALQII